MAKTRSKPRTKEPIHVVDFESSESILTEAFRMLRLHVDCLIDKFKNDPIGVSILITSAVQGEGKTTIACNLAMACASSGMDTLLIDADMRNPNVHRAFNCEKSPGLSDYLLKGTDSPFPVTTTKHPKLTILTAGKSINRSTELLGTPSLAKLLDEARRRYQLVILDSPPIGLVADAGILASRVQGNYLIVRAGKTNRRTVEKTAHTLWKLGADITGIILSRCNIRKNRYLYYAEYPGYYSNYYREDKTVAD